MHHLLSFLFISFSIHSYIYLSENFFFIGIPIIPLEDIILTQEIVTTNHLNVIQFQFSLNIILVTKAFDIKKILLESNKIIIKNKILYFIFEYLI